MIIAPLIAAAVAAQTPLSPIARRIDEQRLRLADLRNYSYRIVFPKPEDAVRYSGKSEYLYSIVSPNGRSLYAIRREFNGRGVPLDTLIRRDLHAAQPGSEETVSAPFSNLNQFAVSPNEKFMVIAGRLAEPSVEKDKRDGVFLLDRSTGAIHTIAPYASLSQDTGSFNVSDAGDRVIYENNGTVMIFKAVGGRLALTDRHAGHLPALMPDGRGYIYSDRGQLILNDGKARRALLSIPNVVGAIRISPDNQFLAFGVEPFGNLGSTRLKICDLNTSVCIDGPMYSEWIAGRETFWIER